MQSTDKNPDNSAAVGTRRSTDPQPGNKPADPPTTASDAATNREDNQADKDKPQTEHGGPKGLEPTRYGDWERNGRCTDF